MKVSETYEWAVRIHCPIRDVPGPHLLECSDHIGALVRVGWWQTNRPEAQAEMLRRKVVVTRHEWEAVTE